MPLERFHRLPEERQSTILDAARNELVAHGASASMNQIIRAAGVSKGAMYYYFEDREDLCGEVIRRSLEEVVRRIGTQPPPTDADEFWAAGDALLRRAVKVMSSDPELGRLARLVHAGGMGPYAMQHARAKFEALTERFLEMGAALGAIRTDVPRSMLAAAVGPMVFGIDRWLVARLDSLSEVELDEARDSAIKLCRDLVGASSDVGEQT